MKWASKFIFLTMLIFIYSPAFKCVQLSKFIEQIPFTNSSQHEQFKNNITINTNLTHATNEIQKSKVNITEKNGTLNEQTNILDLEEKILLKRKNDMIGLLKLNISNLGFFKNDDDFEASYNRLKLINDQLHHLKNITSHILGIKNKKKNITKGERGQILALNSLNSLNALNDTNTNKSVIKSENKFLLLNKKNSTIHNSTIDTNSNSSIIHKRNSNSTKKIENSLSEFLLNSISKENLKKNTTNNEINKDKDNSSTKIQDDHVNKFSHRKKNIERIDLNITHKEYMSTGNASSSLHGKINSKKSGKIKSHSKINLKSLNNSNKLKSVTKNFLPSYEIDQLPSKKTKSETKIPENKNPKAEPNSKPHQIDRESLYTRLVNISLSLIVIGLLMGVMLGLILVMYLKTKKDKN